MEKQASEWQEVGGYDQRITMVDGKIKSITCTCMWGTMEISRHPKKYQDRKPCKHIKQIIEKWKNKI